MLPKWEDLITVDSMKHVNPDIQIEVIAPTQDKKRDEANNIIILRTATEKELFEWLKSNQKQGMSYRVLDQDAIAKALTSSGTST